MTKLAYYRIKDACDRLGVSRSTLCRRIASGELPAWKLGSLTLIPTWAIERAPPDEPATGLQGTSAVTSPQAQPDCKRPKKCPTRKTRNRLTHGDAR